ncbi:MAG TPA: hypothetical protein VMD59_22945, partial [Acidimicrobiales bacterium]|nr:hypothetical protein [Acidimicrobiales bacterium]
WLPDPLARGVTLRGFPEDLAPTTREWLGGPWPSADPLLLLLTAGNAVGHAYSPTNGTSPSTETVTLPPGDSLDLAVSSALTSPVTLGVWWWMEAQATGELERLELAVLAERGLLWMLTPYKVLRLVHAVLVPLTPPTFADPQVARLANSVQATITDPDFVVDAKSSADIDAQASWTDPVDIPGQDPSTYAVTTVQHAFKTLVPDPGPLEATDRPMEVIPAPTSFAITDGGVVHVIGDTLHHEVSYTCTATSRFAEMFLTTVTTQLATTPATTAVSQYGFDLTTLVVATEDGTELALSSDGGSTGDYLATADGTLALTTGSSSAYSGQELVVTFVPADTSTGPAFSPVHILSTSPPKAPKVARISPAWSSSLSGQDVTGGTVTFQRVGGFVRVYLERPWWSSGGGELLGVVAVNPADNVATTLPAGVSPGLVTTMGLDPISVSSLDEIFPISPNSFGSLASVPAVPYRPAYANPPLLPLLENPTGPQLAVWPYEVNYDSISNCWYADVAVSVGAGIDGPPPGWFLRLALVRFQPYSISGAEISQVTLCTFCQPVPDRTVTVTENSFDPVKSSVIVTVTGPGYYGFRPPNPASASVQDDWENEYALQPYSTGRGTRATSTIVVEVQVQDTSFGLSGDLAWTVAPGFEPMALTPVFEGADEISWNTPNDLRGIPLPYPLSSATPMRLRISELDYFPFNEYESGAPATVDTSLRRPFVVHIPVNYVPPVTSPAPVSSPSPVS